MRDVVIIGAGVSGCAIARELSRFALDILVLEKEEDVCCGTSKANSGIVHAGFDAPAGSLMAKLNVAGSRAMEALSKELDFPYRRNGSLVLMTRPDQRDALEALLENGRVYIISDGMVHEEIFSPPGDDFHGFPGGEAVNVSGMDPGSVNDRPGLNHSRGRMDGPEVPGPGKPRYRGIELKFYAVGGGVFRQGDGQAEGADDSPGGGVQSCQNLLR